MHFTCLHNSSSASRNGPHRSGRTSFSSRFRSPASLFGNGCWKSARPIEGADAIVQYLRQHLLILQCVAKKKPPPKAGAPKRLSGVWPCFHLVRRFSSQTNHLYSTSTATEASRRLIACLQTASSTLRRSLRSICHHWTLPKP